MNKLFTKIVGATLGFAMAIGVGVAVAGNSREAVPAHAETATYHHTFSAKPDTGNNVTLSSISWNITATELGNYNSQYYAGVQIGTKKATGEICLTSSSAWGAQSGTYKDKTVISEIRVWMNKGGGTTEATVTVGGTAAISDGTVVVKNSSAASYTDTTCVTFTPATNHDTGVVVITVNASGGAAGYICAMEIDCDEPASDNPDFTLDKNAVNLTLGGSSTTVTATPNEHVSGSATYTWSRTSGDDCVTLTNDNTATVTIAPKSTAVFASCTLTIAVTGCTSKTVAVSVKKVSTSSSPFTVAEAKVVIDDGSSDDKTGVYVHGIISQVDSYQSNTITYWISDDGSTTGQFEVYKGKGLNNANFNAVGDLAVGYEVTVYGNITLYNSSVYEFSSGNYLTSLILPDSHGVSTSTSGLSLDKDVISSSGGTVAMTTAAKKKGSNVVVGGTATSSVTGNIVSLSNVETDITINATIVDAQVTSIALSGQTTKFALGGTFSFDGTVTGTYDDWVDPHTSETIASGYVVDSSDVDMNTEDTYTVTVTYGSVSKSYTITVAEMFDNTKGEYHKVTDLTQLYDGAHVAIVDADEEYSMKDGFDTSKNNIEATSITADTTKETISKTGVLDVELVKTAENEYRFKVDDDLYLYASSSSSNYLKAASLSTSGDNGKFLIGLSGGTFSVVAQGTSTRNYMRFNPNNGSPLFACYGSTSTTGNTVAFYVFKTYTAEANAYAETFIKGNGSANTCAATVANWSALGTAYGKLTDGAQDIFEIATHNAPETYTTPNEYTVEHAVARYDDALLKHTELRSNEFMGRVDAGTLSYSSTRIVNSLFDGGSNAAIIIVVISMISITAFAGYMILRKKKEQ